MEKRGGGGLGSHAGGGGLSAMAARRIDMTSGKPKSGENYLGRKSHVTAAKKGGKFICGQEIS
jgi:hypothetical protein